MQNQKSYKAIISTVAVWVTIILAVFTVIYWGNVKLFFATTPQARCEALIKSSDKDSYCTEAGKKGSRKADRLTREKSECLAKSPYFQWIGETVIVEGRCERVRYQSRQACIDDGKQGVRTIHLPKDEGGGLVMIDTRCFDDGTWRVVYSTE